VRPNESLRARRERRLAAGREAFPATVRGVRGAATILQDRECGDTFDAAGPTSVGPGSTVTTVRPRDARGRPFARSVQILPSVALGEAGSASAPDVRRTEIDAAPTLTAADPDPIPAGDTTSVTFIGLGLVEEPLTVIVAVMTTRGSRSRTPPGSPTRKPRGSPLVSRRSPQMSRSTQGRRRAP
jgi:hypothetical protein